MFQQSQRRWKIWTALHVNPTNYCPYELIRKSLINHYIHQPVQGTFAARPSRKYNRNISIFIQCRFLIKEEKRKHHLRRLAENENTICLHENSIINHNSFRQSEGKKMNQIGKWIIRHDEVSLLLEQLCYYVCRI